MASEYDLNTAGAQRSFEVIPPETICVLQMNIRPGGVGDGGWLKRAANGASEHLDCEFVVVGGDHDRRKIFQPYTLHGTGPNHAEAGEITRRFLRAVLESVRSIQPSDTSEAAQKARNIANWGELDGARFMARLGVQPPKGGYPAKNTIQEVITPDRKDWKPIEQPVKGGSSETATAPTSLAAAPASAISRPQWA